MDQQPGALPVEHVAIETIHPHPRNYRKHPPEQLDHIIASLTAHGFYRPILVTTDGTILAGHGVYAAARTMGLTTVPISRLAIEPNDPRALKVLTGDKEISRLGEMDDRLLTELLREVGTADPAKLLGTGFDHAQLANLVMVTRPTSEIPHADVAKEWIGMPEYDSGGATGKTPHTLHIRFESDEARAAFCIEHGIELRLMGAAIWFTVYPFTEEEDPRALRFETPS